MTQQIYLLIGSNEGDRYTHLAKAIKLISELCGSIRAHSGIYETAPWGKLDQSAFLNQALCINTDLTPDDLLVVLKNIEKMTGRVDTEKWGPRIIDVDILFYGNEIVDEPNLRIPHPYLPERRFALVPLAEIAPSYIHPQIHKSIAQLLIDCPDHSEVTPVT